CFLFKTIRKPNISMFSLVFMQILTELSTHLWVTLLGV
ncbi:hypothetical protein, partial [uncultured Gammaproteobacteria bacterium]